MKDRPRRHTGVGSESVAGHSRSNNGVTSFAYDPAIHRAPRLTMDHRVKPGGDAEKAKREATTHIENEDPTPPLLMRPRFAAQSS